ncbi:gap junction delta-2 protein-like [Sphaeramia orbicularis]|uniref:gap junction delta-2 protein-like n=1 Tax=Sphaeramia orbicularis TaxID=375764 RepID=UPI00117C6A5C|nr:gap junction delta-2 protein-like [Sphaeramia orbicularis]XP_029987044.1 gap junction delta-2 protein-like [Sphaeramia orbicularis]
MTEWTLLKRLLDAVHQHSTMIGRLWLTVMVIFRLLIVAVATEDVYTDEQEMFVCNTLQPGCSTVCYDAFAPISQPRFWVFHIISVSTPSLCFIIYTWHNLSKLPHNATQRQGQGQGDFPGPDLGQDSGREAYDRSCDSDSCSIRSHKHLGHSLADVLEGITIQNLNTNNTVSLNQAPACTFKEGNAEVVSGGVLSKCYIFHVCLRAVLEVGFVLAQWKLFGFQVPVHFLCTSPPCSQPVDCYVSRPTEKTIFLLFMFCVGVFCILLNLLELNHLGWKKIRQVVRLRERGAWGGCSGNRRGYETFLPDSPSPTSSMGFRDVTSTTSFPTLNLVVGHQPNWTCAANCGKGKETQEVREMRPGQPKRQDLHKGEKQPLRSKRENRGSKQRSTEVWI